MKKTIKILGTKYTIHMKVSENKDHGLENRFGYCSFKGKRIVIADLNTIKSWESETDSAKSRQYCETLRHELIHAYLAESGLWASSLQYDESGWAMNEEMIDWIAIQFPKMYKTFSEVGCLGDVLEWKM